MKGGPRAGKDYREKQKGCVLIQNYNPFTGLSEEQQDHTAQLMALMPEEPEADSLLAHFKLLGEFEEQEATWLVPGWVPQGQITLFAADGGVGKTSTWVDLAAAVSRGSRCILDPPGHSREPGSVLFLTTEDSIRKKLKKKLRQAGADTLRIYAPDFAGDREGELRNLKFGTGDMARAIRAFKPTLCIFDPIQGFVPQDVNMGARNAMRDCMAPLIALGEELGTTFLVVCHTNKRKGAYSRSRISDSSDLWDIARSVIMAGYTEEQGVRYLSNEKNNYDALQETVLFTVNEQGLVERRGVSWKRDQEYQSQQAAARSKPRLEDCKAFLLQELALAGGRLKTKDLDEKAAQAGYTVNACKTAKREMRAEAQILFRPLITGKGKNAREWYAVLPGRADMETLSSDTPVPFELWDSPSEIQNI